MQVFFDWVKNKFFDAFGWNKAKVVSGPEVGQTKEWGNYPLPPTVGEMANKAAISVGKTVEKIFTPVKWILFGVSAALILWGVMGLARRR